MSSTLLIEVETIELVLDVIIKLVPSRVHLSLTIYSNANPYHRVSVLHETIINPTLSVSVVDRLL